MAADGEGTRHEPDAPIRGGACVLAQAFPQCKQVFPGQRACILGERTVAGDEGIPEVCETVEIGRHVQRARRYAPQARTTQIVPRGAGDPIATGGAVASSTRLKRS